jgi:hypothetical protein
MMEEAAQTINIKKHNAGFKMVRRNGAIPLLSLLVSPSLSLLSSRSVFFLLSSLSFSKGERYAWRGKEKKERLRFSFRKRSWLRPQTLRVIWVKTEDTMSWTPRGKREKGTGRGYSLVLLKCYAS